MTQSEKSSTNIYDIAREAGVSIATVSRVLSGSDRVRAETRRRVMAVVEATGYTPNAFARGLGLGSMKMVGILCPDVSDLYHARAVSILERLLRARGLDTLLYCTGDSPDDKKHFIRHLLAKNVDAMLLVGSAFKEQSDNSHIERAAAQVPVIIINGLVECPGVYCVLCDERTAMEQNVLRLRDKGCRRILYVYNADTYSGAQKLAGYREGLAHCELAEDPALILRCNRELDAVQAAVAALLAAGTAVDGVLASEDLLAIGAYKALAKEGLTPPVVGFNNSVLAQCATPALSSVDNMVDTLCVTAVDLLDGLLGGRENVPTKILVTANFVCRKT